MDAEADHREFPVSMDQFPVRAKKVRVSNRTGNLPQRVGIAERIGGSFAERGRKWPELEKIPVIFPVGRESDRARNQQNPVFLRWGLAAGRNRAETAPHPDLLRAKSGAREKRARGHVRRHDACSTYPDGRSPRHPA